MIRIFGDLCNLSFFFIYLYLSLLKTYLYEASCIVQIDKVIKKKVHELLYGDFEHM